MRFFKVFQAFKNRGLLLKVSNTLCKIQSSQMLTGPLDENRNLWQNVIGKNGIWLKIYNLGTDKDKD